MTVAVVAFDAVFFYVVDNREKKELQKRMFDDFPFFFATVDYYCFVALSSVTTAQTP